MQSDFQLPVNTNVVELDYLCNNYMEELNNKNGSKKPCRACEDFKKWSKSRRDEVLESEDTRLDHDKDPPSENGGPLSDCPLDREGLGRNTWGFLHTMAAYYPENPTEQQKNEIHQFFTLFSHFYPCHECAQDLEQQIKRFPPKTDSQEELSQWLCRVHNRINLRLGKPQFDCSKVDERWKNGWADGSCN